MVLVQASVQGPQLELVVRPLLGPVSADSLEQQCRLYILSR
ncbi:MAG: hypothetical protein WA635_02655 [Gallionella sp.]